MKKQLLIIVLILSIVDYIHSEFVGCDSFSLPANASTSDKVNTCKFLTTSTDKTHCCYFISANYTEGRCLEMTDDQYENIKRFKTYLKNQDKDIKIKCSSEILTFSLFALFAFLI